MTLEEYNTKIVIHNKETKEFKNKYQITIVYDMNDADYITQSLTFNKDIFKSNYLLKLVLSLVGYGYKGTLFGDDSNAVIYGHHINENKDFPLLYRYIGDVIGLPSYDDGREPHSVEKIRIVFVDKNLMIWDVKLPKIDELFSTKEEAIEEINKELDLYYNKFNS